MVVFFFRGLLPKFRTCIIIISARAHHGAQPPRTHHHRPDDGDHVAAIYVRGGSASLFGRQCLRLLTLDGLHGRLRTRARVYMPHYSDGGSTEAVTQEVDRTTPSFTPK